MVGNLAWEVARRGLVEGWSGVLGNERVWGAAGWAVVPVQVSVHGGEGKLTLTNSQAVFISARFHFPELQHGVQQNKP